MRLEVKKMGFPPVFDENSRILILGSFPSAKSREIQFYYGHKQNRFWKTVCGAYGENVPETVDEKKAFLLKNGIALWDMVTECEIEGSSDASIKNAIVVDLNVIFSVANIEKILLNGSLAHKLFIDNYADVSIPYYKMTSTSPANPRFNADDWRDKLL